MIKRIVEDWLTQTDEGRYRIPFCQLLGLQGYQVVHKNAPGPAGQGKDILARDPGGMACAFQLKAGDIGQDEWRRIHGQVVELIESPIDHPSFRTDEPRRAILVANGSLSDDVRITILAMNRGNAARGLPELEIRTRDGLVEDFVAAHRDCAPPDCGNWQRYLNLCAADGGCDLREEALSQFLEDVLLKEGAGSQASADAIASSLLLSAYALGPYSAKDNHLAVAKGYVILAAHVMALAMKDGLPPQAWEPTVELCWDAMLYESATLRQEALSRGSLLLGEERPGESRRTWRTRVVMVLGWLAAVELSRSVREPGHRCDPQVADLIRRHFPRHMLCFGEYATPYFFAMALLVEKAGDRALARDILATTAMHIAVANSGQRPDLPAMADPYWTPDELLLGGLELRDPLDAKAPPLGHELLRGAFTLAPLVEALARREARVPLDTLWGFAVHLQDRRFTPEPAWRVFTWRSTGGREEDGVFGEVQSFAVLRALSLASPRGMPAPALAHRWFAAPFLLTYPHRLNRDWGRVMDP